MIRLCLGASECQGVGALTKTPPGVLLPSTPVRPGALKGATMPYVKVTRREGPPDTIYLTWPHVVSAGLRQVVKEAMQEPGVTSVELMDDARSRIFVEEKSSASARRRRTALVDDVPQDDAPPQDAPRDDIPC